MDNEDLVRVNRFIKKYIDSTRSLPREVRLTLAVYASKFIIYFLADRRHKSTPIDDKSSHGAIDEMLSSIDEFLQHLLPESFIANNEESSSEEDKAEDKSKVKSNPSKVKSNNSMKEHRGNIIQMEGDRNDSFEDMIHGSSIPKESNQFWGKSLNDISIEDSSSEED